MNLTDKAVKALARRLSDMTSLSYMQALDDVSATLGHKNWNTLRSLLRRVPASLQPAEPTINLINDPLSLRFFDGDIRDIFIEADNGKIISGVKKEGKGSGVRDVSEEYFPVLQEILSRIIANGKSLGLDCRIPCVSGTLRCSIMEGGYYCRLLPGQVQERATDCFFISNKAKGIRNFTIKLHIDGKDILDGDPGTPTAIYHNEEGNICHIPAVNRGFLTELRKALLQLGEEECVVVVGDVRLRCSFAPAHDSYTCRVLSTIIDSVT